MASPRSSFVSPPPFPSFPLMHSTLPTSTSTSTTAATLQSRATYSEHGNTTTPSNTCTNTTQPLLTVKLVRSLLAAVMMVMCLLPVLMLMGWTNSKDSASNSFSQPPIAHSVDTMQQHTLQYNYALTDHQGMLYQARMLCTLEQRGVHDPSQSASAQCQTIGLHDEILSPVERVLTGEPEAHSFLVEVRDNIDFDGGTVMVTHESCEEHVSVHPMLYPSSPALSALLTERFGPDLIELRIIGPEIQTLILEPLLSKSYLKSSSQQPQLAFSCTYATKFSVLISGIYDMYLHLIHTKFEAFRSFPSQHPRPQNGLLVHVADKFIRATPVKDLIKDAVDKKKRNELSSGAASSLLLETVPLPPGSDPSLKPKPFGVLIHPTSSIEDDTSHSSINKESPFYKALLKLFEGDDPIWGYGTMTKWIRNDTTLAKAFIQERTTLEPVYEQAYDVKGGRGKIGGYRNVVTATERYGFGGCSTLTPSNTPHSGAAPDSSFHPLADLNSYRAFSILQWSSWDEFSSEATAPQSDYNPISSSSSQVPGSTPLPTFHPNPAYLGRPAFREEAIEWMDYVENLYVTQGIEVDVHSFPTRGRVNGQHDIGFSLYALYSSSIQSETQSAHVNAGMGPTQTLAQDLIAVDLDTLAMQSEFLSCGKERTILLLGDQGMASIYESMVRLVLGDATYSLPPFVGQSPPGGVDDLMEPERYPGMECHQALPFSEFHRRRSSQQQQTNDAKSNKPSIHSNSDSPKLCFIHATSLAQLKANPIKVQTASIASKDQLDARLVNRGMNKYGKKPHVSDIDLKESSRHDARYAADPSISSSTPDPSLAPDTSDYEFIPFLDLIARTRLLRDQHGVNASLTDTIDHIFFSWDSTASKSGTSFESFTSDLASFIDWVEGDDVHRWENDLNESQRFQLKSSWPKYMEDPLPMDGLDLNRLDELMERDDNTSSTTIKKTKKLIHTQLTHVASFTHPRIYNPPPNFSASITHRRTIQTLGLYDALASAILERNHISRLNAGLHASHLWIDPIHFEFAHSSPALASSPVLGVTVAEMLTHLKKVLNRHEPNRDQQTCSTIKARQYWIKADPRQQIADDDEEDGHAHF